MSKRTIINVVLDRSGSMQSIRDETITLFNSYLDKNRDSRFTLTQFDSEGIDVNYMGRKGSKVDDLNAETFQPRGMTPLYDAIGVTLGRLDKWLKGQNGKKRPVVVAIITDGLENASREYTQAQIKSMIEDREGSGWQFIYMGANQDAWAVGQGIGVHSTIEYSPDAASMDVATQTLSATTAAYASTGVIQSSHTDVKTKAKKEKP